MAFFLILLAGQFIFALVVIFVLKKVLDKELIRAALEAFEYSKASTESIEISVRFASNLSEEFKAYFESIRKRKFPQAKIDYQPDASLKGGVMITVGDHQMDFSLRNRLQHLW